MTATAEDRWEEVARVFGLVMDASDDERAAILDRECADDDALRREIEELLASDQATAADVAGLVAGAVQELVTADAGAANPESDPHTHAGLAPGEVLDGRYTITRVLGAGGMGVVVAAEHRGLDETVAIKLLRPGAFATERVRRRFMREAKAAARIKSAHVVQVRDVGTLPTGAPYMVMDLLTGADLAAVLRARSPLPFTEACLITLQACEALATAHARGVIHRDIKPGNLFLEQAAHGELALKLLDFGISKLVDGEPDQDGALTRTSDMVGSPAYMSPEQLRSARDVDARSDIWSLGVVLFEMLEGTRPYRADNVADLSMAILAEPLPAFRADVPPALQRVVGRCLEKQRDARYPDVGALARALAPFAGQEGLLIARRVLGTLGAPPDELQELDEDDSWALADTVASSERYAPREVEPHEAPASHPPARRSPFAIAAALVVAGVVTVIVLASVDSRSPETDLVETDPETTAEAAPDDDPVAIDAASESPPTPSSSSSASPSATATASAPPTPPSTSPSPRTGPAPPPPIDPYGTRN